MKTGVVVFSWFSRELGRVFIELSVVAVLTAAAYTDLQTQIIKYWQITAVYFLGIVAWSVNGYPMFTPYLVVAGIGAAVLMDRGGVWKEGDAALFPGVLWHTASQPYTYLAVFMLVAVGWVIGGETGNKNSDGAFAPVFLFSYVIYLIYLIG